MQRLPGAIGYVEWAYAKQNKMTYVDLKNAAGTVVEPKTETFKAAAAGADWSKSFYQILTNEPGKDAWPVVGATFVLLHTTQDKAAARRRNAEVLRLGVQERQPGGYRPRLHLAAGFGRRGNPHAMEGEGEGRVGQGDRPVSEARRSKVQ